MATMNHHALIYQKPKNEKDTWKHVAHFKIFLELLHTTMEQAWLKKPRILSFIKKIDKPPAIAGIGIRVQNDEWPKILLDY